MRIVKLAGERQTPSTCDNVHLQWPLTFCGQRERNKEGGKEGKGKFDCPTTTPVMIEGWVGATRLLFCHHCHYVDRVCRSTCLSAEKRIAENEPDAMREGGENQFGTRSSHTTCKEGRERGVRRFNWRICVRLEPSLIASPASPVLPIPSLSLPFGLPP